jgi:hypothetical protein
VRIGVVDTGLRPWRRSRTPVLVGLMPPTGLQAGDGSEERELLEYGDSLFELRESTHHPDLPDRSSGRRRIKKRKPTLPMRVFCISIIYMIGTTQKHFTPTLVPYFPFKF